MRLALAATLCLSLAGMASMAGAQGNVESETLNAGSVTVTLHLHPFLTEEERSMLREMGSNAEAMSMLLSGTDSFAAIAVSPDEGFFRNGVPASSAIPVSQLPDAEAARHNARAACEGSAAGSCVVVLEAAPGG